MDKPEITEEMIDSEVARQSYVAQGGYAPPPAIVPKVELTRSVATVAVGVFIGNLITGLVGAIVWAIVMAAS